MDWKGPLWILPILLAGWADGQGGGRAQVRVKGGVLLGQEEQVGGRTVLSFRGIQYAEPPVGSARFLPSRPLTRGWSGVKSAREEGLPCPQPYSTGGYSEDCLHLSLWTPGLPAYTGDRLRPVLVLLGGHPILFTEDSGPPTVPRDLVNSMDILVARVSSRLNIFGFLSLGNGVVPGNAGLVDQYLALVWLRDNVRYFGGDPERLVVAGAGSGAASALLHAVSPRSAPYIKRVLASSGSLLAPWALQRQPAQNALRFIRRADCVRSSSVSVLACLQALSVRQLLGSLEQHLATGNLTDIFAPVADVFLRPQDQFLGDPEATIRQGRLPRGLSFMLGESQEDGTEVLKHWQRNFQRLGARDLRYFIENTVIPVSLQAYPELERSQRVRELILFQYFPNLETSTKREVLESLATLLTDSAYLAPTRDTLQTLASARAPVYHFTFTQRGPRLSAGGPLNRTVVGGEAALLYLLGPAQISRASGRPASGAEREVCARVADLLVPWIESGAPSSSVGWPAHTARAEDYMQLNSIAAGRRYRIRQASFWLQLLPRLASLSVEVTSNMIDAKLTSTIFPFRCRPVLSEANPCQVWTCTPPSPGFSLLSSCSSLSSLPLSGWQHVEELAPPQVTMGWPSYEGWMTPILFQCSPWGLGWAAPWAPPAERPQGQDQAVFQEPAGGTVWQTINYESHLLGAVADCEMNFSKQNWPFFMCCV